MEVGACSHIGKVRDTNEDAYYISDNELKLFIIADGMGGHNAGEIASHIAIDTIKDYISKRIELFSMVSEDNIDNIIKEAIIRANQVIFTKSSEEINYQGMGTTLTVVLILSGNAIYIGHVGDSRAYLYHNDKFRQITQDHSLVGELLRNGSITENEARIHPKRNIITRALGTEHNIIVDLYKIEINNDDIIVLCTDGLSNVVDVEEIEDIIIRCHNIQEGCEHLVSLANERGGYDNITVVAIKMGHNE
ncbi:MAG: Stp1/IreP family PP2C-type Ser/Thr phosphatase [Alkaliphilus sp.]|nr:Stp1/IreP family PP2C-type Ser/Thr phosphatase [Alkaliphilus sp.]